MGVILVMFGVAAVCAALAFVTRRGAQKRAQAVAKWPTAQALVTSTDIIRNGSSWNGYLPWITYSYEVEGKAFEGDRIRLGGRLAFSSQKKAEDFLQRFPVHGRVPAYYDPKRPNVALLDPAPYSVASIAFLVLAICIGSITALTGLITMLPG